MGELAQASREKHWSELGIEEKVERMRQIIKQKDRTISNLWGTVEQLRAHVHAPHDGHILYDPVQSRYGMLAPEDDRPRTEKGDEVYF